MQQRPDTVAFYQSETKQISRLQFVAGPAPAFIDPTYALIDVSAFVGMNARVAYTFDNDITVALRGANIQSSATQTNASPDVERRFFVSLSKKF